MIPDRLEPGDPFGYFGPDRTLRAGVRSAAWLNGVSDAIRAAGQASDAGASRRRRPIMARLSGASSPYSWVEVYPDPDSNAWLDHGGGRGGESNAYEVNGLAGLGGKVVTLRPGAPGDYRFIYDRGGTGGGSPPLRDCQPCGLPASGLSASVRYRIALCSGPPFVINPCECFGGSAFPLDVTIPATLRFVDKPLYLDAPGGETLRSPYHWVSGPHCIPTTVEGVACGCPGVVYAEAEGYFVLACEDVAGRFYVARRWKKDANLWPTCDSVTPAYTEEADRGTMNMIGGGAGVGEDTSTYRSFTLAGSCSPLALSASYTGPSCSLSPIRYTTQQEDVSVTL